MNLTGSEALNYKNFGTGNWQPEGFTSLSVKGNSEK